MHHQIPNAKIRKPNDPRNAPDVHVARDDLRLVRVPADNADRPPVRAHAVVDQTVARRLAPRLPVVVELTQLDIRLSPVTDYALTNAPAVDAALDCERGHACAVLRLAQVPVVVRAAHRINAVLCASCDFLAGYEHVRAVAKLQDVVVILRIRRVDEARRVGVVAVVGSPVGVGHGLVFGGRNVVKSVHSA